MTMLRLRFRRGGGEDGSVLVDQPLVGRSSFLRHTIISTSLLDLYYASAIKLLKLRLGLRLERGGVDSTIATLDKKACA